MKANLPAPLCPSCGEPMKFPQSTAALSRFYDLQSFACSRCGVTLIDPNPEFGIDSVSAQPHKHFTRQAPAGTRRGHTFN